MKFRELVRAKVETLYSSKIALPQYPNNPAITNYFEDIQPSPPFYCDLKKNSVLDSQKLLDLKKPCT